MSTEALSAADKEFLTKCEEELKDRYTDKDEGFMKVFNSEPSTPPIVDPWWARHTGRRNDRRYNRRHQYHTYERHGNRDRNYQGRDNDNRSYNDNRRRDDDRRDAYQPRYRPY